MNYRQALHIIYTILKWIAVSLCAVLFLYSIAVLIDIRNPKILISICCFQAMAILLSPPLSEWLRLWLPIFRFKALKGVILLCLFFGGASQLPQPPEKKSNPEVTANTDSKVESQKHTVIKDSIQVKSIPVEDDTLKMIERQDAKLMQRVEEVKRLKEDFGHHCMNPWDDSCIPLLVYTKNQMNDPESFEHVETRYRIENDYAIVVMSYRGKNAYGGTVQNYIKAKVSLNCEVVEVYEN